MDSFSQLRFTTYANRSQREMDNRQSSRQQLFKSWTCPTCSRRMQIFGPALMQASASDWIAAIGPARKIGKLKRHCCMFPAHGKFAWNDSKLGREDFSYSSKPCKTFGRHGFWFSELIFFGCLWDPTFMDFQILAQDHFQTPPDPKQKLSKSNNAQKNSWSRTGIISCGQDNGILACPSSFSTTHLCLGSFHMSALLLTQPTQIVCKRIWLNSSHWPTKENWQTNM